MTRQAGTASITHLRLLLQRFDQCSRSRHDRLRPLVAVLLAALILWAHPTAGSTEAVGRAPEQPPASHVAGEVIVKVTDEAAAAIEHARQQGTLPTTEIASLDQLLTAYQVQTIDPLFGPMASSEDPNTAFPERAKRIPKDAQPTDLSSVYKLQVPPGTDITTMVEALSRDPHIVYAQPNYLATTNAVEGTR